ncbi:MAG: SDR family oxidoreductase [Wolbachia endosymbiont of Fragariocoptes setiger]|nr:SDR family oxidoreductase [Wolbachia endosymbiont of Fragariocoptes setiger]
MTLNGKVALITGASGVIGSAVAKRFVKEGARVILISRSMDKLNSLYNEIKELGELKDNSVTLIQLNLLDFENIKLLASSLKLSECGALDILVACAGISGEMSSVQDYDFAKFQSIINTNFVANWYLLKNFDAVLKKSRAGRVIFVTSDITLSPSSYPYWGAYASSKAALETMLEVYSSETKHTKLCINAIRQESTIEGVAYKQAIESDVISVSTNKFLELASDDCNVSGKIFHFAE